MKEENKRLMWVQIGMVLGSLVVISAIVVGVLF